MVSGYTLTAFPNAFILQQPQLKAATNKPKQGVQTRNKDCAYGSPNGLEQVGHL